MTGSDVFLGLFSNERPLRTASAEVDEPTSAELIPPRSIPVIAISGFVHCRRVRNGPAHYLFPPDEPTRPLPLSLTPRNGATSVEIRPSLMPSLTSFASSWRGRYGSSPRSISSMTVRRDAASVTPAASNADMRRVPAPPAGERQLYATPVCKQPNERSN